MSGMANECATRWPISRSANTTWSAPTRSRIAPWSDEPAFAMTFPTPSCLSAIPANTLASTPSEIPTIAWSKSAAPIARSAASSAASSWTACVTSGAISLTTVSFVSTASTSCPSAMSSRAAAAPKRPRPMTRTDVFMGLLCGSADADRLDGRPVRHRLCASREGEDERERPEAAEEHRDGEQRDRQGTEHDLVRHPPAERLGERPATDGGDDREQEDRERRHLDAAGRRTRSPADEHEGDGGHEAGVGEAADRNRAHAGRPERGRLEQRVERPLDRVDRAEGVRVAPLEREQRERPAREQHGRGHQHELRLEREPGPAALVEHVAHDRHAETAEDDQQAERHEHDRVVGETAQALEPAHEVEARVVEGGDRVEQAVPRGLGRVLVAKHEGAGHYDGADPLRDDGEYGDAPEDASHRPEVARAGGLLGDDPVAERRAAANEQEEQQRRAGHEPEPTGLDEAEDDDLSERAPVGRGVDDDEPRDAHRGCGREQGGDGVRPRSVRRCDRQDEEAGPDRDEDEEPEREGERGTARRPPDDAADAEREPPRAWRVGPRARGTRSTILRQRHSPSLAARAGAVLVVVRGDTVAMDQTSAAHDGARPPHVTATTSRPGHRP